MRFDLLNSNHDNLIPEIKMLVRHNTREWKLSEWLLALGFSIWYYDSKQFMLYVH